MTLSEQQIKELRTLAETTAKELELDTEGFQEYWYNFSTGMWEKGEMERLYLNLKYGRTYKGRSKWKRGVTYYIDLKTGEAVESSREYNNARERGLMEELAEVVSKKATEFINQ